MRLVPVPPCTEMTVDFVRVPTCRDDALSPLGSSLARRHLNSGHLIVSSQSPKVAASDAGDKAMLGRDEIWSDCSCSRERQRSVFSSLLRTARGFSTLLTLGHFALVGTQVAGSAVGWAARPAITNPVRHYLRSL